MSELGKVIEELEKLRGCCGRSASGFQIEVNRMRLESALHTHAPTLIAAAKRAEQAEAEVGRLRTAIARALNDSETGDCWGPDVTVAGYLREALTPPPAANEGATA